MSDGKFYITVCLIKSNVLSQLPITITLVSLFIPLVTLDDSIDFVSFFEIDFGFFKTEIGVSVDYFRNNYRIIFDSFSDSFPVLFDDYFVLDFVRTDLSHINFFLWCSDLGEVNAVAFVCFVYLIVIGSDVGNLLLLRYWAFLRY